MKTNPILDEVWRIKDQLAAEAGYDMERFFDQLRTWTDAHPHPSQVVRNTAELQQLASAKSDRPCVQSSPGSKPGELRDT